MSILEKDRNILRELAKQVAEIAALPIQQETISLWKALNGLKPVRPMVMIDQVCWNEMNVDDELTLHTKDEFSRAVESDLRRTLYAWNHMRADMVVEPVVSIPKAITGAGFGIEIEEERAITDSANDIVGHLYFDQLKTDNDLEKIVMPDARLDETETARRESIAHEIFDGILDVEMTGLAPMFNMWDWIVQWRGAENVLLDLADRPDFMHRLMSRVTESALALLDQAEARGLLTPRLSRIHCTGAHTDELPAPGFDPLKPRAKDLWTCGMAQIFSSVSPAVHKEFEIDYAVKWYKRFGLVYYGCCEPLHSRLDMVKEIPNLRKISMSPWVDIEKGADGIGRDFVFSRKPSPAFLSFDTWDPLAVEKDLRTVKDACRRHGCPVEFILKDISTVRYQPQKLWEWADVAMKVALDG
jgi:hypothetical protein